MLEVRCSECGTHLGEGDHPSVYAYRTVETPRWHLDGESHVHRSATVENTEIGPNVHVIADATVHDATLEKSVVFPEATVQDAEIRETIIDEQTHLEALNLSGAVIGAHTRLNGD